MEPSCSHGNNGKPPTNECDNDVDDQANMNIDNHELEGMHVVDEDNGRLQRVGAARPDEDGMSSDSSSSSSTQTDSSPSIEESDNDNKDLSDEENNEETDDESSENDDDNDDNNQYNNHYNNAKRATKKRRLDNADNHMAAKRMCLETPSLTMHCGLIEIMCEPGPSQAVELNIHCVSGSPRASNKMKRSKEDDKELSSVLASTFGIEADKEMHLLDIKKTSHSSLYHNKKLSYDDMSRAARASRSLDMACEPPCDMSIYVGNSSDNDDVDVHTEDLSVLCSRLVKSPATFPNWLKSFLSLSTNAKTHTLRKMLKYCASVELGKIVLTIKPNSPRDFITLLPKEVALILLTYLEAKDLVNASLTCRYWRELTNDNLLWKEKCRTAGIYKIKRAPRYLMTDSPWKSTYMKHFRIDYNWINKCTKSPVMMIAHDDHVITCLEYKDNFVLTGSDDCTLKMWSACSGRMLYEMAGHRGGVWSAQMTEDRVVSGSTDRTLRIWNRAKGQCLYVLSGHSSTVRCLQIHGDKIVSGSRDATLRIWSLRNGKCLRILRGHSAAVRCVQYNGKYVVSGSYDHSVKVWNPLSGKCIHTLTGHTNKISTLVFNGQYVVSGSLDSSIKVWDVKTGELKQTLLGHMSLTSGMVLRDNILISGNADSSIKLWNIHNGRCIRTLDGPNQHQSAVTCLQTTNRFIISSSEDGTVKLWDIRTGNFIRDLVELENGGAGAVVWRIKASPTRLVCAIGSRNLVQETQVLSFGFNLAGKCIFCND